MSPTVTEEACTDQDSKTIPGTRDTAVGMLRPPSPSRPGRASRHICLDQIYRPGADLARGPKNRKIRHVRGNLDCQVCLTGSASPPPYLGEQVPVRSRLPSCGQTMSAPGSYTCPVEVSISLGWSKSPWSQPYLLRGPVRPSVADPSASDRCSCSGFFRALGADFSSSVMAGSAPRLPWPCRRAVI